MRAAAYIGRVGGLAVALGVGAAVATGHGVAWADDTTSPAGSTSQESPSADNLGTPNVNEEGSTVGAKPGQGAPGNRPSAPSTEDSGITTTVGNGREPADRGTLHARPSRDVDSQTQTVAGGRGDTAKPDPVNVEQPEKTAVNEDTPETDLNDQQGGSIQTSAQNRSANDAVVVPRAEVKIDDQRAVRTTAAQEKQPTAATGQNVQNATTTSTMTTTTPTASAASATTSDPVVAVTETVEPPAAASAPTFSALSLVSRILGAFGLGTLAGPGPSNTGTSPLSWIFLAFARRDFERIFSPISTMTNSTAATDASVAAAAVTAAPPTEFIDWVTGPNSPNATPARFSVSGTDLGIMWDNGETDANRQVLVAFGDTFSGPAMTGEWRSNILFRSADRMLSDANGLLVPNPQFGNIYAGSPVLVDRQNFSKQLVYGIPGTIGLFGRPEFFGSEVTIIPTAGVSVPGAGVNGATRQYMNVMSIRQWGPAGMWTTNYSAIAYSDNNGENWVLDQNTIRSAGFLRTWGHDYVFGNENFQQGAFVRPPEGSQDAAAGYIYSFGTPAGRFGPAYVSRVHENRIQNLSAYEYWDGQGWVQGDPSAAVPVFAGEQNQFGFLISLANNLLGLFGIPVVIPTGDASEMSVQYNEYLDQYIVLYTDNTASVVMRTAPRPEGPWSGPLALTTSAEYAGLYAPMIHPWSSTGYLLDTSGNPEDPRYLYWNLSQWDQYNVRLMRTDLTPMQA
jgi:hypothetical protein